MVYFIRIDGNPLLKVGRTQNINARIKGYEDGSGRTARCFVQFVTDSLADSIALENFVVAHLAPRYQRSRREWFNVPPEELPTVVSEITALSPVPIKAQNGDPGARETVLPSLAEEASREARSVGRAYGATRGRNPMRWFKHWFNHLHRSHIAGKPC